MIGESAGVRLLRLHAFNEFHYNIHHSGDPVHGNVATLGPQDGAPGLHNGSGAEVIGVPGCQSDEFADLTEDVLESVARRAADGKRGFYATALANTATPSPPGEDERERMLDALEELRLSHLRLLAIVATTRSLPEGSNLHAGGIDHNIMPRLEGVSQEQMRADWADLARLGILDSYPSGTMSRQGIEDLTVRMTDFGRRFVDWISLTSESP